MEASGECSVAPNSATLLANAPTPQSPVASSSLPLFLAGSASRSRPHCSALPACGVHPECAPSLDTLTSYQSPPATSPVPLLHLTCYSSSRGLSSLSETLRFFLILARIGPFFSPLGLLNSPVAVHISIECSIKICYACLKTVAAVP